MQDICNRFIGSKFSVGCMVCRDANYSKIKSTFNISYSSIDMGLLSNRLMASIWGKNNNTILSEIWIQVLVIILQL